MIWIAAMKRILNDRVIAGYYQKIKLLQASVWGLYMVDIGAYRIDLILLHRECIVGSSRVFAACWHVAQN